MNPETKFKCGDSITVNNVKCEIVSVGDFDGTPHYGVNWRQADSFMGVAGWVPCWLFDLPTRQEAKEAYCLKVREFEAIHKRYMNTVVHSEEGAKVKEELRVCSEQLDSARKVWEALK